MTMPPRGLRLEGRVLYLTEDNELLRAQLAGQDLAYAPDRPLLANISTDEITPGWVCYYFDETLGRYCLVGLRGGTVTPDAIRGGRFAVLVSGPSKGCGSSRETAPYSEVAAGIRLVIAPTLEKIYRQNAQNIGLLTSTDLGLVPRILSGETIGVEEFTRGLDPISAAVVEHGGLFAYNLARLAGHASPPPVHTPARPMTLCEKILARHAVSDPTASTLGVEAVAPGDAFFARADVRYSHEYVTPMAEALFQRGFGADATVVEPSSVYAFRDHLTLLDSVMSPSHRAMGLDVQAKRLAVVQDDFSRRHGITLYGEVQDGGPLGASEAICHNKIVESIALPGQLVVGTDSHTCMVGALGCLAFGIGATDMANAWRTRDVRVLVPPTLRVRLHGTLSPGVCAKDVMLHLLRQPFVCEGRAIAHAIEFAGDGVRGLSLDERATLANMAVEAGAFTGIVEPDETTVAYLAKQRGLDPAEVRRLMVQSDPHAEYAGTFDVDATAIEAMVATPGDPRNGIALSDLGHDVPIHIAYGGSCTGGKKADMDMYARVLGPAAARGQRVAPGVSLFVQYGSQEIRRYAEAMGYAAIFDEVGAQCLGPSCGACIKAGPGSSTSPEQVTVSAQNRNYPGRSGPGMVYLASPYVVAASALAGRLTAFRPAEAGTTTAVRPTEAGTTTAVRPTEAGTTTAVRPTEAGTTAI